MTLGENPDTKSEGSLNSFLNVLRRFSYGQIQYLVLSLGFNIEHNINLDFELLKSDEYCSLDY